MAAFSKTRRQPMLMGCAHGSSIRMLASKCEYLRHSHGIPCLGEAQRQVEILLQLQSFIDSRQFHRAGRAEPAR